MALALAANTGATALTASAGPPRPNVHILSDRPETAGQPVDVLKNYALAEELFVQEPTRWGGAYVDGDSLVVKFASGTIEEAQDLLKAQGVSSGVTLQPTNISMAELTAANAALAANAKANTTITSFGPDYASSSLAVDVTNADAPTLAALNSASAGVGNLVPIDVVEGVNRPVLAASRYFDSIPYAGGNAIALSNGGTSGAGCSTGFQLGGAADGYAYGVTAGHCYTEPGRPTYPDVSIVRSNGVWSGMATVWTVSVNNSGTISGRHGDLAIYRFIPISGRANSTLNSGYMYTGTGNSTVKRRVTGTADLPQGYQSSSIRTSGASGYWNGNNALGEISPDWVHLVDQTVLFSTGQSITGLTDVEDAIECVSQGDSGGAVYLQSGSTEATAVGIMSGTDDGGAGLTNCRNYYTPVKYIYYGGAIKLG